MNGWLVEWSDERGKHEKNVTRARLGEVRVDCLAGWLVRIIKLMVLADSKSIKRSGCQGNQESSL